MKKFILVLGASCLLAGCGSQNLAPLEDKTTKLRDDNHQLKLDKITNKINEAFSTYKSSVDNDSNSEEDKQKRKEISKFDKDLSGAMNKIRNGYQSKDAKQIKKGQQKLTTVSSNISS